jgi:integrase
MFASLTFRPLAKRRCHSHLPLATFDSPHVTLHDRRHSFTVVGIESGITMYKMSKALGHSSLKVTWERYAHLIDQTHVETISIVSDLLTED